MRILYNDDRRGRRIIRITNGIFFADLFVCISADHIDPIFCGSVSVAKCRVVSCQSVFLWMGRTDHDFFDVVFDYRGICVWLLD